MEVSEKSAVASSTTDFSSDSTLSDEWQELTKSDYAKVIFSDLLCNAASGTVECKFQITDNVHEDPSDYVGLYRIGYDDLSQCLVSKMLSQTKCEDDGKLQRCVFTPDELPCLDDGFYQFLYVTRDQEVCGASMPFFIKMMPPQLKASSVDSSSSENMDSGFLLVRKDSKRELAEKPSEPVKAPVQESPLSEKKKEEIAAWVSENPDYSSLIEQIREHTYTIDALQQSKDLAMKEVSQLYEVLNAKNTELNQMRDMVAAYEEKVKMSQALHDEKNAELMDMKESLRSCKEKYFDRQNSKEKMQSLFKDQMKRAYENKIERYEIYQKQKEEELSIVKNQFFLLEEKLKASLDFRYEQEHEVTILRRELESLKRMQKEKEKRQVAAETEGHTLDSALKKAENLVLVTSDAIKCLNFKNEVEVDKFYQLKIQLLITLDKMRKASDSANICVQNESVEMKAVQTNDIPESSIRVSSAPSRETPSPASSNKTELASGETSTALAESISLKGFEPVVLENQTSELPRIDVLNEIIAKNLQAMGCLEDEDISAFNRLTEKMVKRGLTLFQLIEMLDDCTSDSGSDGSDLSDCSSSVKKDLVSVSKVFEVLSNLSHQTNLDHLIGVETDKNRNKWDMFLQKYSYRYQAELLLEHVEKQKEGVKKVSEKICDLLAQCMVLKDELSGSKSVSENLRSVISKKDTEIANLKAKLDWKQSIISHLNTQRDQLEYRRNLAERTVEDYRARIEEAFKIYRNQYAEIDRLSRKLEKCKALKNKTKYPQESCSPISSESSTSASSFEVVKKDSVQNINDSDTGEHMFEKASFDSKEDHDSKSISADVSSVQSFMEVLKYKAPEDSERKYKMVTFPVKHVIPLTFADAPNLYFRDRHSKAHRLIHEEEEMIPSSEEVPSDQSSSEVFDRTAPYLCFRDRPSDALEVKHKEATMQTDVLPTSEPEKPVTPPASAFAQALPSGVEEVKSADQDVADTPTAEEAHSKIESYEDFQKVIKMSFDRLREPVPSPPVCCYLCSKPLPPRHVDLMNHLESEHSTKVCPVCGQLFEEAVPVKYFQIHVERHFEAQ